MTWIVLIIVVIAIFAVACLSFRSRDVTIPTFSPDPQNDKIIVVDGWNESEMQKIIHDFVETYKNDGYPAYRIEPHKQSENLYRLTFPQDIHPKLFSFLVNFLAYPFDLDLTNRTIVVAGKATFNVGFNGVDASLFGMKAIFYVPENDEDYDVIYAQTESGTNLVQSFKWSGTWKPTNDARLSNAVKDLVGRATN